MTFAPGEKVRVSDRPHEGHHRTPGYVKGRMGTIERVHDRFLDPETCAYGGDGKPERRLYLVGFDFGSLWPAAERSGDRLLVDVFEHWLESPQ